MQHRLNQGYGQLMAGSLLRRDLPAPGGARESERDCYYAASVAVGTWAVSDRLSPIGASRRTVTRSDVPPPAAAATHSSVPEEERPVGVDHLARRRHARDHRGNRRLRTAPLAGGGLVQPTSRSTAAASAPALHRTTFATGCAASVDDDLDSAVLRLAHTGTGRHHRCVSPKPWMVMAFCGTPSLTSSACTARARRTDRPWFVLRRAGCICVAVHLDPRGIGTLVELSAASLMICRARSVNVALSQSKNTRYERAGACAGIAAAGAGGGGGEATLKA